MSSIPVAWRKHDRGGYENFVADCPVCNTENTFNRVSDLGTTEVIDGKDVECQNPECAKPFRVVGDSVDSKHQTLIYDCYELIEKKQYMFCIINLCQAFEAFFSFYLQAELLSKPYAKCTLDDIDSEEVEAYNRISELLYEKLKRQTFDRLRNLFLRTVIDSKNLNNLIEAETAINALPDKPTIPSDEDIEALSDSNLASLLLAVKKVKIHEIRNRVVHKDAFRPSFDDAKNALSETSNIIFPLTELFSLDVEDTSWFMEVERKRRSL